MNSSGLPGGWQPRLVGAEAKRLARSLVDHFSAVSLCGTARVVVVTGPQGYGKSRLLWSVYEALAERQPKPSYWPSRIVPMGTDEHLSRKVTFPEQFVWRKGSLPTYFWWAIGCEQRNSGRTAQVLREDIAQIVAHQEALTLAWTSTLKHAVTDATSRMRQATIDEAVSAGVSAAVAQTVPFVGLALDLAQSAAEGVRKRSDLRRKFRSDVRLDPIGVDKPPPFVVEMTRELEKFARAGLPVVVAIEDAHTADPTVLQLLEACAQLDARVLVIVTTWPSGLDDDQPLGRALSRIESERIHLTELTELSIDERAALVRIHAPSTPANTLEAVARRLTTPLLIEETLRLPQYQRNIVDGALLLAPSQIDQTPVEVEELYLARWDALTTELKTVLVLVAAATPRHLTNGLRSKHYAPVPVVLAMASRRGVRDAPSWLQAAEFARLRDEHWIEFIEPVLSDVVWRHVDLVAPSDYLLREARAEVVRHIHDHQEHLVGDQVSTARLNELHVQLVREGHMARDVWAVVSALNGAIHSTRFGELDAAVQLLDAGLTWFDPESQVDSDIIGSVPEIAAKYVALGLQDRGRARDAVPILKGLVDRCSPGGERSTDLRFALAGCLEEAGSSEAARQVLDDLIADQADRRDPAVLAMRWKAATWRIDDTSGDLSTVGRSMVEMEEVAADARGVLPEGDALLRNIERHIMAMRGGQGDIDQLTALAAEANARSDWSYYAGLIRELADISENPLDGAQLLSELIERDLDLTAATRRTLLIDRAVLHAQGQADGALLELAGLVESASPETSALDRDDEILLRLHYIDALVREVRVDDAVRQAILLVTELASRDDENEDKWLSAAVRSLATAYTSAGRIEDSMGCWQAVANRREARMGRFHKSVLEARLERLELGLRHGFEPHWVQELEELHELASNKEHDLPELIRIEIEACLADAYGRAGDPGAASAGLRAAATSVAAIASERPDNATKLVGMAFANIERLADLLQKRVWFWERRCSGESLPDYWGCDAHQGSSRTLGSG